MLLEEKKCSAALLAFFFLFGVIILSSVQVNISGCSHRTLNLLDLGEIIECTRLLFFLKLLSSHHFEGDVLEHILDIRACPCTCRIELHFVFIS